MPDELNSLVDEILSRIAVDSGDPSSSALPQAVFELYWRRFRDEGEDADKRVFVYLAYASARLNEAGLKKAGEQLLALAKIGLRPNEGDAQTDTGGLAVTGRPGQAVPAILDHQAKAGKRKRSFKPD